MDARPVIVGMNNPHGSNPKYALYPYPTHSAGGRLFAMLHEAADRAGDGNLTRATYLAGFDRRNVLATAKWDGKQGKVEGAKLASSLYGRRVVMLGRQTASAMGVKQCEWWANFPLQPSETSGLSAWVIPHPSGLNPMYNDPEARARTGDLLYRLLREVPS